MGISRNSSSLNWTAKFSLMPDTSPSCHDPVHPGSSTVHVGLFYPKKVGSQPMESELHKQKGRNPAPTASPENRAASGFLPGSREGSGGPLSHMFRRYWPPTS